VRALAERRAFIPAVEPADSAVPSLANGELEREQTQLVEEASKSASIQLANRRYER
jgi:hypothetical protein